MSKYKMPKWATWGAFGSLAVYLFFKNKKESQLSGKPNEFKISIDKQKLAQTAVKFIPIVQNNPIVSMVLDEFIDGYNKRRK